MKQMVKCTYSSKALEDIATERVRQIEQEGWSPEWDDDHRSGELARAAACYALSEAIPVQRRGMRGRVSSTIARFWPWVEKWWKPRTHRENLVRAGALIAAEIERLDRKDGVPYKRVPADDPRSIYGPGNGPVGETPDDTQADRRPGVWDNFK